MTKAPSALGTVIATAVAAKFPEHRHPVQYLAVHRTRTGTVFAFERVTLAHINLWLPEQENVRREADRAGFSVRRTKAWPNGRAGKYGRIHTLKAIPELCDEPLLKVQVTTAGEAIRVLEALE